MKQTPARIALAELIDNDIASLLTGVSVDGEYIVELLDTPEGIAALRGLTDEYFKESMASLKERLQSGMKAFMECMEGVR